MLNLPAFILLAVLLSGYQMQTAWALKISDVGQHQLEQQLYHISF